MSKHTWHLNRSEEAFAHETKRTTKSAIKVNNYNGIATFIVRQLRGGKKKKKEKDAEDHVQTHAVIWDVIIIN